MTHALARLLLPLLLLAQVFAGMSPGSVLCIATGADCCDQASRAHDHHHERHHEHRHAHAHGHAHAHASCNGAGHESERDTDRGTNHGTPSDDHDDHDGHAGLAVLRAPSDDGCGCHFHVALPGDAGGLRARTTLRIDDLTLLPLAIHAPAAHGELLRDLPRRASVSPMAPARDAWHASDQCRARAVTRLLI